MEPRVPGLSAGSTVFISAGASGIGLTMAKRFLAQDCLVHVCDINEQGVADFIASHPNASGDVVDVSDYQQVKTMFEGIATRFGHLDVLINNAGVAGPTASVEDMDPNEWDKTIAIDLNSIFYVTKEATPLMKAKGGAMINIASNAALFGFPMRGPYTAAKWAVLGLTKTWAMELGVSKIRVNAICPGSVNGPRIEGVIERDAAGRGMTTEEIRTVYQRQSSMRLFVEADDIANTALFLASDMGKSISGQTIAVDGHTEGLSNFLEP